jgi:hypothetical protein
MKTIILFMSLVIVCGSSFSQYYSFCGHTIVKHDSLFYYLLPNDSLIVDTTTVSIIFKNHIPENIKTEFIASNNLTLIRSSLNVYDYRKNVDSLYINLLSILDTSQLIERMIYSLLIPLHLSPNDYWYTYPWPNDDKMWFFDALQMEQAWNYSTGDQDIKIAVLDTGIDVDHEDIAEGDDGYTNIDFENSWNFYNNNEDINDYYFHGTMVSGLISAKMNNNSLGVASIAGGWGGKGIDLLVNKISHETWDDIVTSCADDAIVEAVNSGARIINCSWGGVGWYDAAIDLAINYAIDEEVLVFALSGNYNYYWEIAWPASHEDVIGIGGTMLNGQGEEVRWEFDSGSGSNYSTEQDLELVAPATVFTTYNNGEYIAWYGTSFSSALAAGVTGLALSINPCLSAEETKNILYSTADQIGPYDYIYYDNYWYLYRSNELGFGRINAYEALKQAAEGIIEGAIITGIETWDEEVLFSKGDIIVESGGILTITGDMELRMFENTKIVVRERGRLNIDDATITNACEGPWLGIEVHGDPFQPHQPLYQGMVYLSNNAAIKNATCGIRTARIVYPPPDDPQTSTPDYDRSGGIILATDASFIDNEVAVWFYPYVHNNISSFSNCIFETEEYYLPGDKAFKHFIRLYNVSGIDIINCDFINSTPEDYFGNGIFSFQSTFAIKGECVEGPYPCTEWDFGKFENLEYGIYALVSGTERYADITHTIFEDNFRGVFLRSMNNARITSNIFHINTEAVAGDLNAGGYGCYLDVCNAYWIEDNDFEGVNPTSPIGLGLYINNSGLDYNEVYNNRFYNTDFAIVAQGINRGQETGLEILCNEFTGCNYDISVVEAINSGIAPSQGSGEAEPDAPAGNRFSYTGDENTPSDINNEGLHINYYYHLYAFENLKPLYFTQSTVTPWANINSVWSEELSCPPSEDLGGELDSGDIKEQMNLADQKIDSIQGVLQQLVDGGDSEILKQEVEISFPEESFEIYCDLMSKSPYLSDSIVAAVIYKEDVLPNAMVRDIMVSNPQSAKQDSLIEKLDDRWEPLPDYMMQEILQSKNLIGAKEELESQLSFYKRLRESALNRLVQYFLTDTISPVQSKDSLINLPENEQSLAARYRQAFLYSETNQYEKGQEIMDSIPDLFILTEEQLIKHEGIASFYSYLVEKHQDSGDILFPDSTQFEFLLALGAVASGASEAYAQNVLITMDELQYYEPVFLPSLFKSALYKDPMKDFKDNYTDIQLKVYPNPARDFLIVEYSNSIPAGESILIIRDSEGKEVINVSSIRKRDQILVNLPGLESGLYYISLYSDDTFIKSAKFTVIP